MLFYMKKKVAKFVNLFCFIPTIGLHKVIVIFIFIFLKHSV